jgi:hypothetical protein
MTFRSLSVFLRSVGGALLVFSFCSHPPGKSTRTLYDLAEAAVAKQWAGGGLRPSWHHRRLSPT